MVNEKKEVQVRQRCSCNSRAPVWNTKNQIMLDVAECQLSAASKEMDLRSGYATKPRFLSSSHLEAIRSSTLCEVQRFLRPHTVQTHLLKSLRGGEPRTFLTSMEQGSRSAHKDMGTAINKLRSEGI